ncbi:hypothetical protein MMRN_06130 [Mycobacterium marinum]|nr:hypothetical protein MMRN_06130 [Mycobacterium marinum]
MILAEHRRADGRAEYRLCRGEYGYLQAFRQPVADQRDGSASAHGRHRGQAGPWHSAALQHVFDRADESVQGLGDELFKLVAGKPDIGTRLPRRARCDGGHRRRRQVFFGEPAPAEQKRDRPHAGRRTGNLGAVDTGGDRQEMTQDELVDLVAGELPVPEGRADLLKTRTNLGQRYAGAAGSEIAQRHHAAGRESRCGPQRCQCGRRIRDHRRSNTVGCQGRLGQQRPAQRAKLSP